MEGIDALSDNTYSNPNKYSLKDAAMRRLLRVIPSLVATMFAATLLLSPSNEAFAKGWDGGGGGGKGGTVNVRPYTKKDGTYVAPHHRTGPDSSKGNNWSTKGNTNPYMGKPGTKQP